MRPLDGITVVALEQAVAAPFATRQLADLGARVIKIERPGSGDFARQYDRTVKGLSSHFVWLNRSKESLTLDLKHDRAKEILWELALRADVFIQNLAPGATARLGFGAEVLRARHSRLIVCDVSGYGPDGPYRDKKAYDLLVQAEAGVLAITGIGDQPAKAGIPVADIAAGMYAYSGILAGLFLRERTGQGTALQVSLMDALAEWMGYPAYYTGYGGTAPVRAGASHAAIAPYGPFATGDDKVVLLSIQNEREWRAFCEVVLEEPGLATDPAFCGSAERVQNRAELHRRIDAVFQTLTVDAVTDRLERARVAYSRMRTVEEFLKHPQLAARHRWGEIDSPVGRLWALRPPVDFAGIEPVLGPVPEVGHHNVHILGELGYDAAQIAALRADGVI
ncbi:MAG TPA: CaiB/BaiF CoA-transferase family protein [Alphaproteobacteria bacterium]|nr:CaiB/BaiF CoA-transferase family protein [Alphaproteobacteria bacterium]